MGKFLNSTYFNSSIIRLIRYVLNNRQTNYFVTAKAPDLFGQISKSGESFGNLDPIGDETSRSIDFDNQGPRNDFDPEASVEGLNIEVVDEDTIDVKFTLKHLPQYIFLKMDYTPSWGRKHKNILKSVVGTNSIFKKGLNHIRVKRLDTNGLKGKLAKAFFYGKSLTFSMGISIKDRKWGFVSSQRFFSPLTTTP